VPHAYSTYEAKGRFSEILRKVRSGGRVVITYRGKAVAEIRPIEDQGSSMPAVLQRLEEAGVVTRAEDAAASLSPVARLPGALARFLEERE